MVYLPSAVAAGAAAFLLRSQWDTASGFVRAWSGSQIPAQAQVINQLSLNVLGTVEPATVRNGTGVWVPPGYTMDSLMAKPFLVYDDDFYAIIGNNPTLTLIGETDGDPLFHEAVVWFPPTDEVFFAQNAGAPAAGTGLNQSAIISKIALSQADAVSSQSNAVGQVNITSVEQDATKVINPNGGTNWNGKLLYVGEGQGADITSAIYAIDPYPPYNTTVVLDNYFGRQFNSLNDIAVNSRNRDVYFTDTLYGYLQDFRPVPGLRNQVYRWNPNTGAVTVVADGFVLPNGITFSPDGQYAYVTDTGINHGFFGFNYSDPASIYRFDVQPDGTFDNRMTFAFVDSGVPDGIHCDSNGNVYSGCGDGVHVWNPSGKLLGKIWLGTTSANFQFAGQGRMVICAETQLFFVTLAATGADITGL